MDTLVINSLDRELWREINELMPADIVPADALRTCLACGTCTGGCPVSHIGEDADPRKFVRMVLLGMRDRVLSSPFVWTCTMCGRCTLTCPMGISIADIVRTIRGKFVEAEDRPQGLQSIVDLSLSAGNNMGLTQEDYLDTLEWMEEELQSELGDPTARIPVDKPNARIYYTLNPREPKFFPLTIQAIAKIFHIAGEDWSLSTSAWDCTNYALFNGDDEAGAAILGGVVKRARELGSKTIVISECGHAFRAAKWGSTHWLDSTDMEGLEIKSVVELMADYIASGRIRLNPEINSKLVTYHDPCNLGRKEGFFDLPRYVLRHAVKEFVEMTPNREYNYCCGGGGGALAISEYGRLRIERGEVKAEQLRRTGASIVVTPCHNCVDQLSELSRKYKLKMQVKNLMELVADALIVPGQDKDQVQAVGQDSSIPATAQPDPNKEQGK